MILSGLLCPRWPRQVRTAISYLDITGVITQNFVIGNMALDYSLQCFAEATNTTIFRSLGKQYEPTGIIFDCISMDLYQNNKNI
jgi:hypothetical protein